MSFPFTVRFSPTPLPTLAAGGALLLLLYLGQWQQSRAAEKRALQAEFSSRATAAPVTLIAPIADPARLKYSRAVVRGEWLANEQIFIDNKFDTDAVGFNVITPLKIEGTSRVVLVNRGWIPRGRQYPVPPEAPPPSGNVVVEGVLTIPSERFLELNAATTQGRVWQNLTIERFRTSSGLDTLPLVLLAHTATPPLRAVSERPDARVEKHVEYMLTWYSLAATVLVLWVALNFSITRRVLLTAPNHTEKTV